jgi:hypothetical protein
MLTVRTFRPDLRHLGGLGIGDSLGSLITLYHLPWIPWTFSIASSSTWGRQDAIQELVAARYETGSHGLSRRRMD